MDNTISKHDVELMHDAQNKLWDLLSSYPEEDRLKVAGVCLKVTLQLYQIMLDGESIEKLLSYVMKNLQDVQPIYPAHRTLH